MNLQLGQGSERKAYLCTTVSVASAGKIWKGSMTAGGSGLRARPLPHLAVEAASQLRPRLGWSGAHRLCLSLRVARASSRRGSWAPRLNSRRERTSGSRCHLLTWPLQDCAITSPVLCLPPSIHSLNHSPVNILEAAYYVQGTLVVLAIQK